MNNIYNDFKQGKPLKGLVRISAILALIMAWILIDKGNIYGQNLTVTAKTAKTAKNTVSEDSGQSLFKTRGDDEDDDEIIKEDPDSDDDNNFDAYPNPFEKDLVFDFEFTVRQEQGAPVEVIDMQGKIVEKGTLEPGSAQYKMDLSGLQAGMYLVRVKTGSKLQVKRVIKK